MRECNASMRREPEEQPCPKELTFQAVEPRWRSMASVHLGLRDADRAAHCDIGPSHGAKKVIAGGKAPGVDTL